MTQMRPITSAILPLRLEGASYAVGDKPLLSDISLVVKPGRRLVVLGANGAGKSLLLRLCHGLIAPTAGRSHALRLSRQKAMPARAWRTRSCGH